MKASDDIRPIPTRATALACRGFLAFAVAGAALTASAQAVTGDLYKADFDAFRAKVTGSGSQQPVVGGSDVKVPTTSASSTARVGGMNFYSSGSGSTVGGAADFKFGNFKVPVGVRIPVEKAAMGRAIAGFGFRFLGPIGVGVSILDTLGYLDIEPFYNAATGKNEFKKTTNTTSCPPYDPAVGGSFESVWPPAQGWASHRAICVTVTLGDGSQAGNHQVCATHPNIGEHCSGRYTAALVTGGSTRTLTEQELADEIASAAGWPTSAKLDQTLADAVNAGQPIKLYTDAPPASVPAPSLTGPAEVTTPPQRSTTTAPGPGPGETTVSDSITNPKLSCTYVYPQINCKETTTTTTTATTTKPDGTTSTAITTKTTDAPPASTGAEKPANPCEDNPDSLGCAKLDTPEVEVPKVTKDVTLDMSNELGEGSCPPPHSISLSNANLSVSYQPACDFITTWMRPALLAIAAMMAMFIVAGGIKES